MNTHLPDGSVLALLGECVHESEGLSGRALRKLPFQAFVEWLCGRTTSVSLKEYLMALKKTIQVRGYELEDYKVERKGRSIVSEGGISI